MVTAGDQQQPTLDASAQPRQLPDLPQVVPDVRARISAPRQDGWMSEMTVEYAEELRG